MISCWINGIVSFNLSIINKIMLAFYFSSSILGRWNRRHLNSSVPNIIYCYF